jgi:hypothetical protein
MKIRIYRAATFAMCAGLCAFSSMAPAQAGLIGPVMPYTSFNDSPFSTMNFTWFHLIRMTDSTSGISGGPMTAPGATTNVGPFIDGPGGFIDSVDGTPQPDDGRSLFYGCGSCGITFTFDAGVLGSLPTAAGIAWTDGIVPIHFSAIDANGNTIGQINDSTCCDFNSGDNNPAHFRFFGVTDPVGIKSIFISNDGGGIEVDHLQYGLLAPTNTAVPEPSTIGLTLFVAGFCLTVAARRRRTVST